MAYTRVSHVDDLAWNNLFHRWRGVDCCKTRTLNPVLHVLLHSLQADHELYPPSTKEGRDYGRENRNLVLINFDGEILKHQVPQVASILNHTKGKCFSSNTFLHHGASYAKYDNVFRAQEVKHRFRS